MGKNTSAKQTVTDYFMSVHFGVCTHADAILGVYVNDREAWSGVSTAIEGLSVNKPDLFGGNKKEGGLEGTIVHLPGANDQVLPPEVTSRYGLTPTTMPAYRQLTSIMFIGSGAGVTVGGIGGGPLGDDFNEVIGTQYGGGQGGFKWSSNNPVVAQKIAIKVRRAPKTSLNPAYAMIGTDANPAHMILECMTNTEWGMGSPVSDFDLPSFEAAALTLFNENFGLSMIWTRQTEIENFVAEINDHILGLVFLSRRTGKWKIKLVRDDYDVNTLRHLTPDVGDLSNFDRRMWGEIGNEVSATWTNPVNEQPETVTAQDLAATHIQGATIPIARDYYGVRNSTLAMTLAQRDVRAASAALASANFVANRQEWDIEPGEVVIVTWPEYQLAGVIMRAGEVSYGRKGEGSIKISLLEDIFSLEKPPILAPPGTQWQDPGTLPAPMAAMEVTTVPSYFALSADFQANAIELAYPEVLAMTFGYQADPDTTSYALMAEGVGSTGAAGFFPQGNKSVLERTVLANAMPAAASSRLPDAQIINKKRGPEIGGFLWFGAGSDANMEITQAVAFDETTQEWVLARGVLDTIPHSWPVGTPVWVTNPGDRIVDDRTIRSAGEEVDYKFLSRTSRGLLPLADAPTITETLTARPHLPLRPGNVKVNDIPFGTAAVTDDIDITWATRNRNLEDGQVVRWDALPVPPEYAQGTIISVVAGGNTVYEQKLWTANAVTLQASWFARWATARIYVSSRREEFDSLQGHYIDITGLANNPGAPAPPVPPDPGPPPALGLAPAIGAWAATGFAFEKNDAGVIMGSVPAILVSGVRDRADAVGLIVRYALNNTNDWYVLPTVTLSGEPTQVATTAVRPDTDYKVEIAYVDADGTLSAWRSLGVVTTGAMIVGSIGDIGYQNIKNALEFLGTFTDVEKEALSHISDLIADVDFNAEAILAHFVRNVEQKERFESLTHLPSGVSIGNFVVEEQEQRLTAEEAFNFKLSLLGSVGPNGNAWIINASTTWINSTMSFAAYEQSVSAQFQNQQTLITNSAQTSADATGAVASELHILGAKDLTGSTFIINDNFAKLLSSGQSVAQTFQGVTSQIGQAQATAIQSSKTYVDSSSAFAQVLSTLGVTSGQFSARITQFSNVDTAYGAKAGLRLDVNGHITGFSALNDGITGAFIIVADFFAITTPNGNVVPFTVFNGEVYMPSVIVQRLAAGSVTAGTIVANTITANHIVGGAVTNMLSFEVISNQALGAVNVPVTDIAFTYVSDGGKHLVVVYGDFGTTGAGAAGVVFNLICDGQVIGTANKYCPGSWGGEGISFPVAHTPGAGSHNYSVTYSKTAGSGAGKINRTLVVITELKK